MLAETIGQLVTLARGELNDAVAPYLWSDTLMFAFATEACDALAKDAEILTEVIHLPIVAGTAVVPLPARIEHIRAASLLSAGRAVFPANINSPLRGGQDDYGRVSTSGMFDDAIGTPVSYIGDYDPGAIRLSPIPGSNDTLVLQCVVSIDEMLTEGDDVPFPSARDQRLLLHHIKYSAYGVHDKEVEDPAASAKYKRLYDDGAKARKSALHNNRRTPGFVRMEYP